MLIFQLRNLVLSDTDLSQTFSAGSEVGIENGTLKEILEN